MAYTIKTLSQLQPTLKAFRKQKGLTQATMAEKLGITQQSYAHFEANPLSASFERLFFVMQLLEVELVLQTKKSVMTDEDGFVTQAKKESW